MIKQANNTPHNNTSHHPTDKTRAEEEELVCSFRLCLQIFFEVESLRVGGAGLAFMSEPIVVRSLRKMPYRTSLLVVFFSTLFAVACSGSLLVYSPEIWQSAANATSMSEEDWSVGMSAAGVSLLFGVLPGTLVDKATPMLCAFLFAGEAFAGYLVLFFVAKGILLVTSWVVVGVLFFLIGQACVGMVLLGVSVLSFNAPVRLERDFFFLFLFTCFEIRLRGEGLLWEQ